MSCSALLCASFTLAQHCSEEWISSFLIYLSSPYAWAHSSPAAVFGMPCLLLCSSCPYLHAPAVLSGAFQAQDLPGTWCSEIQGGGVHIPLVLGR